MKHTEKPIVIQAEISRPVDVVWRAITHHEEMVKWYFDNIPDFKPEVGFYTEFPVSTGERIFTHQWTITEVEPLKHISYEWKYKEYPGKAIVTMQLEEKNHKTLLTLIDEVIEDFPDEIPEFKRESGVEGWTYFIEQRLKPYLEKMD